VTTPRWDAPWTTPTGSAPERPPGEPGPGLLAVVHLAAYLGASAVAGLTLEATGRSGTGLLVVAVLLGAAGFVTLSRRTPLLDWVADLLLAVTAGYAGGGAGLIAQDQGASDPSATLVGALVALGVAATCYARHRRVWLQVATVASAAVALGAAVERQPDLPKGLSGALLVVLGGFVAVGCLSGLARPVRSGYVLAAVVAAVGTQYLVDADALVGGLVTFVLLGLVAWGIVESRNRSLLPVALLAGAVLLPQVLSPAIGTGKAIALSLAAVAASVGWLAVDLERRSVRPVHIGGVFAFCLVLLVVSGFGTVTLGDHDSVDAADKVVAVLHALLVVAFFGAAAAARRRPATVISGFLVVGAVPSALAQLFDGPTGLGALFSLPALAGAVWVAIRLDKRAPRPAASPYQQESSLTGAGREWTVVVTYPVVFDSVVAALGGAGLALQLVDRAAGRIVAGDAARPTLVVAVWAGDPVRTQIRAVGEAEEVDWLEADLAARLNALDAPH
jgi:hypothetical protein